MISIKLLKFVLPLSTGTIASFFTISLISFKKKDLDQKKNEEDSLLENLELKLKEFKEEIIEYAEEKEINTSKEEQGKDKRDSKEPSSFQEVMEKVEKTFEKLANIRDSNGKDQLNLKLEDRLIPSKSKDTEIISPKIDISEEHSDTKEVKENQVVALVQEQSQNSKSLIDNSLQKDSNVDLDQELESFTPKNDSAKELSTKIPEQDKNLVSSETSLEDDGGDFSNLASEATTIEKPLSEEEQIGEQENTTKRDIEQSIENKDRQEGSKISEDALSKLIALKKEMLGFKDSLEELLKKFN